MDLSRAAIRPNASRAYSSDRTTPAVYNLAQFAFSLNPARTKLTGEMFNDEGVNGTVHIGT